MIVYFWRTISGNHGTSNKVKALALAKRDCGLDSVEQCHISDYIGHLLSDEWNG